MESSVSDMDENLQGQRNINQRFINVSAFHNRKALWNKENDAITTLYKCNVVDARALYIFDSAQKLLHGDQYDIGGAYSEKGDLWFYFTTTVAPSNTYLMNIFVCHRSPGILSVAICESNHLISTTKDYEEVKTMSNELEWKNFKSTLPDENHYIRTFCFTEEDRLSLTNKLLMVPLFIKLNCKSPLNRNLVEKIRAEHDFGEKLFKDVPPDFVILSRERKPFKVHKIVIAAHSPVLRDLIREKNCKSLNLNMPNSDIDLLLQFLYTGRIDDILHKPLETLLIISDKFHLQSLNSLARDIMKCKINSNNVLHMAVLAEQHDCKDVQEIAFKYVAFHPEILNTEAFSQLKNTNVVEKLLRFIHREPPF